MDFFKVKKFGRAHKPNEKDSDDMPVPHPEEPKRNGDVEILNKSDKVESNDIEVDDDEDDDFITNEVQRRLKELRRNSFMVLIPEETGNEEEEEDEEEEGHITSSTEEHEVELVNYQLFWCDFDTFYRSYCERMLFFDKMSVQLLKEADPHVISALSPRSARKKLSLPFSCLSLKKFEEPQDDTEQLHQPAISPLPDLEMAYVAQICLTWEALHCQYTQLKQKISAQPENPTRYNHSAQEFQHFQVLLQRFIENEPYQEGSRTELYARGRILLPKLLQVPSVKGSDITTQEEETNSVVLAPDLIKLIESSIITYSHFLKMDKKKPNGVRNLFGKHNQVATPLQQVHSALDKKKLKLKELKKKRGGKHRSWPTSEEEVDLLLGIIEVKLLSRVLRMTRLTKEQLIWCEDKMKKLNLSDGQLHRDPSPLLFPC